MENNKRANWLTEYVKRNPLQVTLQLLGVGILILNFWLASKLTPLVEGLNIVNTRVDATEEKVLDIAEIKEPFIVVQEKTINIEKGILELKDAQIRLEEKIDRLLQ